MLEKVTEWLSDNAPKIVEALQGPASQEKFIELESLVGKNLPEGLVSLYQTYNGIDSEMYANFVYGIPLLSIEQSIAQLAGVDSPHDDIKLKHCDKGIKGRYTFGKLRIPIADDAGTCILCVDLDPDIEGVSGQVILIDHESGVALKLADSVEDCIESFASDLISGKYTLQEDALEDGVHWLSPAREIDPVNWFNSPTWKYVSR